MLLYAKFLLCATFTYRIFLEILNTMQIKNLVVHNLIEYGVSSVLTSVIIPPYIVIPLYKGGIGNNLCIQMELFRFLRKELNVEKISQETILDKTDGIC